jgi:hypothetical protein
VQFSLKPIKGTSEDCSVPAVGPFPEPLEIQMQSPPLEEAGHINGGFASATPGVVKRYSSFESRVTDRQQRREIFLHKHSLQLARRQKLLEALPQKMRN